MEEDAPTAPTPAAKKGKKSVKASLRATNAALVEQVAELQAQLEAAAAATSAERTAQLESELAAVQAEVAKLTSVISKSSSESAQLKSAEQLMKFLPRPMQFDGVGQFTEFRAQMQMHLSSVNLPTHFQAPVAAAYLKGAALQWWTQLRVSTPMPASWDEMLVLLNARFDHLNPEMAARSKLQTLRQGSLSVHAYLKEFEGCYAHIPVVDEKDKIFRFNFGLNAHLREKFAVNPTTYRVWESFTALVAYITNFVADTPAAPGAIADKLPGKATSSQTPSNLKAKGGVNKPNAKKRGMSADKAAKPSKTVYTKLNKPVTRSNAIKAFAMQNKLCLGCYGKDHFVADCTKNPVSGTPPGFTA
jgi:Retrotransposon gag protein